MESGSNPKQTGSYKMLRFAENSKLDSRLTTLHPKPKELYLYVTPSPLLTNMKFTTGIFALGVVAV